MKKEQKQALGLAAVFSALALMITFLVIAVRKRSITAALLALTSATGGAVGATLLLDSAVEPDPDGENVVMPEDETADSEEELFDGDEAQDAARAIESVL